jgi:hypothetical protein
VRHRRPWDDAKYRQRRAQVMRGITVHTRCWRCGRTAAEHPLHSNGKRGHWQCGHVLDNDPSSLGPLAAEWSTCNAAHGGVVGNERRWGDAPARKPRQAGPHFPGHYDLDNPESVGAPPCVRIEGALCPTCVEWRAKNPKQRG